jgi:tRNA threonylcarbamoyladenosine biosynthesis protein TsaE
MIIKRKDSVFECNSPDETELFGRKFAGILKMHDVVCLTGVLGAGKTCLIKGIGTGLGISGDEIKSPSFTLVNEYNGRLPLFHFDLYRMKDISELYHIGWNDYLLRDGIVVVEWGEKADGFLPRNRIDIKMEILSENSRRLNIVFQEY